MNDRELLELAAKAAGEKGQIRNCTWGGKQTVALERRDGAFWAPLDDDGDALRLANHLRLCITHTTADSLNTVMAGRRLWNGECTRFSEQYGNDEEQSIATRRAIVRAAAEIGRSMP